MLMQKLQWNLEKLMFELLEKNPFNEFKCYQLRSDGFEVCMCDTRCILYIFLIFSSVNKSSKNV